MKDPTLKYAGTLSPGTEKVAKIISFIAQPPFLSIPAFVLMNLVISDISQYAMITAISLLFATILPTAIVYYWSIKLNYTDGDIPNREDRYIPLVVGIISYLIGTGILFMMGAPKVTVVMMLCYAVCTFFVLIVSLYWKISIHATGVVGPTMGLCVLYGPWGLLFITILPFVMWSRYVLKKHTPMQLVAGALLGFTFTGIIFLLLL